MKKSSFETILLLCAFLVAMSVGVAQAGAVIDFDGTPVGPIAGNLYKDSGVLLSTDAGSHLEVCGPVSYTNTPYNYLCAIKSTCGDSRIIVDFVLPGTTTPGLTDIVVFYLTDPEAGTGATWKAEIFGYGNVLIDTKTGNTNDEISVAFTRLNKEISRMIFTPSEDYEGIDTLSHCDVVPVPEPASLSALGFGIMGIIFSRRRR